MIEIIGIANLRKGSRSLCGVCNENKTHSVDGPLLLCKRNNSCLISPRILLLILLI